MIAWPPPISARCMMPAGGITRSWPRATRAAITDGGQVVLHHHASAADVADARRVDRLLQVQAAIDQVDQHLRVPLRLDVAAHHAVGHQQPAVLEHHRRNQRVERPLAGLEAVRVAWLEREAGAAIVQHDAGVAGDDAGAERVEDAVDERHGVAVLVDDREIGRVAAHLDVAVGRRIDRLVGIDQRAALRRVVLRQQLLDRHLGERRIGDVAVAIRERNLRRLDQRVVVARRIVPHRRQVDAFEDVEQHQRGQPLVVRRKLVERVAAVGRRDRLDPRRTCARRSPPS